MKNKAIDIKNISKMRTKQLIRSKIISGKNLNQKNAEKLISLKNKYVGQRCFIVGGSPSLNQLDLTKLNNEYIYTVNRGYKLKEQGLNHSTFHVITDPFLFWNDHVENEMPVEFSDIFFISSNINFQNKDKTVFISETSKDLGCDIEFQEDITKPLVNKRTVIYAAIQLAFLMGFKEIYLIGVDLDYDNIKGHAYKETPGEKERNISLSEKNCTVMFESIIDAYKFLKTKNIQLFNASPVNSLNGVQKVKYEDLFNE